MSRFANAFLSSLVILVCLTSCMTIPVEDFQPLPPNESLAIVWPTPNQHLFSQPDRFFAQTAANPDYGKPGWSRDCGKRLHRGCDIAPIRKRATGQHTTVEFTDCETGQDYESQQPTFIPQDTVFAIADGIVEEAVSNADLSDYGIHTILRHSWPDSGQAFYSLYGHLDTLTLREGSVVTIGQPLGTMGRTSRIADARNWMAIAPHLHFEVWNQAQQCYNPESFLRRFLQR